MADDDRMGLVSVDVEVSAARRKTTTNFLVDSGANYSVLPRTVWKRLGLRPKRTMRFALADGTAIRRQLSECRFRFAGIDAATPVVLGEARDVALLGTVTLETMGLVLHPFERRLRPLRMLLARQAVLGMGFPARSEVTRTNARAIAGTTRGRSSSRA
jgi:clan AA aspartic protease